MLRRLATVAFTALTGWCWWWLAYGHRHSDALKITERVQPVITEDLQVLTGSARFIFRPIPWGNCSGRQLAVTGAKIGAQVIVHTDLDETLPDGLVRFGNVASAGIVSFMACNASDHELAFGPVVLVHVAAIQKKGK